jgi:hypothetical protein
VGTKSCFGKNIRIKQILTKSIKIASGEIVFYDKSTKNFSSLEQLLKTISDEYANNRTAETVNIRGFDGQGKIYRLYFDFNNFAILEETEQTELRKPAQKQKVLGEILIDSGVVTPEQLKQALEEQSSSGLGEKIGETCIRLGFCDAQQILFALAKQIGVFVQANGFDQKNKKGK